MVESSSAAETVSNSETRPVEPIKTSCEEFKQEVAHTEEVKTAAATSDSENSVSAQVSSSFGNGWRLKRSVGVGLG